MKNVITSIETAISTLNLSPVTSGLIQAKKGSFQSVAWKSTVKPRAEFKGMMLEKITHAVCKAGIDFSNLSSVKQAIESGERREVESLPWGEWEAFPFTITHKGERYVRLYPASQANQAKTVFLVNGKETTREDFSSYLTPSDAVKMTNGEKSSCFCVKESNLID